MRKITCGIMLLLVGSICHAATTNLVGVESYQFPALVDEINDAIGQANTALKTKADSIYIGGFNADEEKYLFIAPYACTVDGVSLVSDTATADSVATTNWSFEVKNLTEANSLGDAKTTETEELAGDTEYELTVTNNLTLSDGDVLELEIKKTDAPTALDSAEIIATVIYH